jgi:hypothetical protein
MKASKIHLRQLSLQFIRSIAMKPSIRLSTECSGSEAQICGAEVVEEKVFLEKRDRSQEGP